jgi:hypothetical protein
VRTGRTLLRRFGECKRLAQGQALLDLLFLSVADDACKLPTPMSVSGADANANANANANGATVESTVKDCSECL